MATGWYSCRRAGRELAGGMGRDEDAPRARPMQVTESHQYRLVFKCALSVRVRAEKLHVAKIWYIKRTQRRDPRGSTGAMCGAALMTCAGSKAPALFSPYSAASERLERQR